MNTERVLRYTIDYTCNYSLPLGSLLMLFGTT